MAQLTASDFIAKWLSKFANNSTGIISETFMREFTEDIADSFLSPDVQAATTSVAGVVMLADIQAGNIVLSDGRVITGQVLNLVLQAIRTGLNNKENKGYAAQLIDVLIGGADSNSNTLKKLADRISGIQSISRPAVSTIAERDTLPTTGLPPLADQENVYVTDATGDPSVEEGPAIYRWLAIPQQWIKISEPGAIDFVLTAAATAFTPITGITATNVQAAIAQLKALIDDLIAGSVNLDDYYTKTQTDDFIDALDSDAIEEGVSNQYFTADRAIAAVLDDTSTGNSKGWSASKIIDYVGNAISSAVSTINTALSGKLSTALAAGAILIGSAGNLATPQTPAGDLTMSNLGVFTLANTGVTAGTYGSSSQIPVLQIDAKGRIVGVSLAANAGGAADQYFEYATTGAFPTTGVEGVYVALNTNKTYRWTGSVYTEISPSDVNSVNGQTGVVSLSTDNIAPGASADRRYYTSAIESGLSTAIGNKFSFPAGGNSGQYVNGLGALVNFPSIPAQITALSGLTTDVLIAAIADKQFLQYSSTAGKWVNAAINEVTVSGDATLDTAGVLTLAATGVVTGTYGGANFIPVITFDAKGRATSVTQVAVTTGGLINPLGAGSASSPSLQIRSSNMGFYSAAANELNASVSGGEILKVNTARFAHRPYNGANAGYATFQGYSASSTQFSTRVGANLAFDSAGSGTPSAGNYKDVTALGGIQLYMLTSSTATGNAIGFSMVAPGGPYPYPTVDAWYCQMESGGTSVFSQLYGRVGIGRAPTSGKILDLYSASNTAMRLESGASLKMEFVKGAAAQYSTLSFYTTTTRHYYISHWADNTLRFTRVGAASDSILINTDGTVSLPMGLFGSIAGNVTFTGNPTFSGTTTFSQSINGQNTLQHTNSNGGSAVETVYNQIAGSTQGGFEPVSSAASSHASQGRTVIYNNNKGTDHILQPVSGSFATGASHRFSRTGASAGTLDALFEIFREGYVFIPNIAASAVPTPTAGIHLFCESGVYKYKDSSGTVKTITTS